MAQRKRRVAYIPEVRLTACSKCRWSENRVTIDGREMIGPLMCNNWNRRKPVIVPYNRIHRTCPLRTAIEVVDE